MGKCLYRSGLLRFSRFHRSLNLNSAKGDLDTSILFPDRPEIAARAARNPVALHKLNNIRSAISRGLLPS